MRGYSPHFYLCRKCDELMMSMRKNMWGQNGTKDVWTNEGKICVDKMVQNM